MADDDDDDDDDEDDDDDDDDAEFVCLLRQHGRATLRDTPTLAIAVISINRPSTDAACLPRSSAGQSWGI